MTRTQKPVKTQNVDAGNGWFIRQVFDCGQRNFDVYIDGRYIGSRDTLDEARSLRERTTYEALRRAA